MKEMDELAKHLIRVNVNSKETLQMPLFRPLCIRERFQQELIGAVSGGDVLNTTDVTAAFRQRVAAHRYLEDADENTTVGTMTLGEQRASGFRRVLIRQCWGEQRTPGGVLRQCLSQRAARDVQRSA